MKLRALANRGSHVETSPNAGSGSASTVVGHIDTRAAWTPRCPSARSLGNPLAFFVRDPLPAVISRRSDPALPHETTRALDDEIVLFAGDALTLLNEGLVRPADREPAAPPQNHNDAELLAGQVRSGLGVGDAPIHDLAAICERLVFVPTPLRWEKTAPTVAASKSMEAPVVSPSPWSMGMLVLAEEE